jgi:ATP-binding cassette subfamily F protein 3
VLLLDEPSNNLSPEATEALIDSLNEYRGGLVIISHNRYMLSRVCTELLLVDGGEAFVAHRLHGGKIVRETPTTAAAAQAGASAAKGMKKGIEKEMGRDGANKNAKTQKRVDDRVAVGFDELLNAYLEDIVADGP